MKSSTKILMGVVIVAVVIATAILFSNPELFKGSLKRDKFTSKELTPPVTNKPLMLVLFSEDTGYPIQISGDGLSVEAAIGVDHCGTNDEGKKWCEFKLSDKNSNDTTEKLIEGTDNFLTMYGNSSYKYNVKVIDITDFPEGTSQSDRAIIELNKVKE